MKILLASVFLFVAVNATTLLGKTGCTNGPSYFCDTVAKAKECGAFDYCRSKFWGKGLMKVSGQSDDSSVCTFCKDMVADVKNFIESNQTQAEILNYMNRACDFMPDDFAKQECTKIETHYLAEFESLIRDNVNPDEICRLVALCNGNKTVKAPTLKAQVLLPSKVAVQVTKVTLVRNKPQLGNSELCDACKEFITEVKKEVDSPQTQASIKSLLDNECQQIGGGLASVCQEVVDMFLPELFSLVDQELTPDLCVVAGLCKSDSMLAYKMAVSSTITRVMNKLRNSGLSKIIEKAAAKLNDNTCDTCEMIAGYAKIFLSNNETEAELASLLQNDVCPQLGGFKDICDDLVKEYLPRLYAQLLEILDPATICKELGLCTSVSKPVKPVEKVDVKAGPQCILCEFLMSKLESMLADNATESEIISAVEKVCNIMPSTIRTECDQLVEQYGKQIIDMLVKEASPSVVCGLIGLCASDKAMLNSENCIMCEMALSYAKSMLKKNATEQQIMQELDKACNLLSGSLAKECTAMIQQYGPMLMQKLADKIDAKAICTEIGMCSATMRRVDGLVHLYKGI